MVYDCYEMDYSDLEMGDKCSCSINFYKTSSVDVGFN